MSLTPDPDSRPLRAVLLAVHLHDVDDVAFASSVAELHRLARTLGLTVAATVTQRRRAFHAGTVVGSGKLTELRALTQGRGAYSMHFSHYQEVPAHVAQQLVEKLKAQHAAEHK